MKVLNDFIKRIWGLTFTRQFLFASLLLTISRIIWLVSNYFWLPNGSPAQYVFAFLHGLRFDLPVLAYFFLPVWIWLLAFPKLSSARPGVSKLIFLISAATCLILNGIDTGFSRVTTKRSGFELFSTLADEGNKIAPYLKDYLPAIAGLILMLYLVYRWVPVSGNSLYIYDPKHKLATIPKLLLVAGLWLLAARGGTQLKPLRSLDASNFGNPALSALISSTPLQFMNTLGQSTLPEFAFMTEPAALTALQLKPAKYAAPADRKNVILIIVESLGRDYTGFLNQKPFTPFLDSLSKLSISFPYCYANGTRSIEMVPSIFSGIPSLSDEQYINSIYSGNRTSNLFQVFRDNGYQTAFFHGGANGTMGFRAYLKHTGLNNYRGLDEYPDKSKDFDGGWGIYDEPYLKYLIRCADTVRKPFFYSVFTLSSHHPYPIPAAYRSVLPKGPLPIHQSIAYTDLALRHFFEEAAKKTWFKNTLFVITGDHTSYGTDDYFYSQTGHYELPLLFYTPGMRPDSVVKTVSQCDIGPSILDFLHLPNNWFGLGRSGFDTAYPGYSLHYDAGVYYLVQYPYVLGIDGTGAVRDFTRRYRNSHQAENLPHEGEQYQKMTRWLMASMQLYSDRIRGNRWFWP